MPVRRCSLQEGHLRMGVADRDLSLGEHLGCICSGLLQYKAQPKGEREYRIRIGMLERHKNATGGKVGRWSARCTKGHGQERLLQAALSDRPLLLRCRRIRQSWYAFYSHKKVFLLIKKNNRKFSSSSSSGFFSLNCYTSLRLLPYHHYPARAVSS